jgi:hypothetical protein
MVQKRVNVHIWPQWKTQATRWAFWIQDCWPLQPIQEFYSCFFITHLEGRGGDLQQMCKTKKGTGLYTCQHSSCRFVWAEGWELRPDATSGSGLQDSPTGVFTSEMRTMSAQLPSRTGEPECSGWAFVALVALALPPESQGLFMNETTEPRWSGQQEKSGWRRISWLFKSMS